MGIGGTFARQNESNRDYFLKNVHGDVTAVTNGITITKTYEYDAYGVEKNPDANDTNPFRYCGEYFDSESESIYLRNRYYSPLSSRFITADTHWNPNNMIYGDYKDKESKTPDYLAISQSTNLFSYCLNNPIKYVDTSGEVIAVATAALVAFGFAIVGQSLVSIYSLSYTERTNLYYRTGYDSSISRGNYIKWWDTNENKKHHVKYGSESSRNNHEPIWRKMGLDPDSPDFWSNLIPILKTVVDYPDVKTEAIAYDGSKMVGYLIKAYKAYYEYGVRIYVNLYTNFSGHVSLSDAWGEFLN